jgi:hypothetical protein
VLEALRGSDYAPDPHNSATGISDFRFGRDQKSLSLEFHQARSIGPSEFSSPAGKGSFLPGWEITVHFSLSAGAAPDFLFTLRFTDGLLKSWPGRREDSRIGLSAPRSAHAKVSIVHFQC